MQQIIFTVLVLFSLNSAQNWRFNIHDPSSIVKEDDKYWIYGTGDGIHAAYSHDLITWTNANSPYSKTQFPAWIGDYVKGATDDQGQEIFHGGFWAPDIHYMNGKYHLYYSASEWGTMTSIVGGTTNLTLDPENPQYKWEDLGFMGIWSYQPGLALNAIDPAVMRGHDGRVWLIYGSFNQEGIVITELDTLTGKPKDYPGNLPGKSIANSWTGPNARDYAEGEGAAGIYHDGYYYLFYDKGGCCAGVNSTYYVVVGRSKEPTGPYVDKEGKNLKVDGAPSGGTVLMKHRDELGDEDRYYGPGHIGFFHENGVDYVSFHYYDPNWPYPEQRAGGPTLGLAKIVWEADGWPSISLDFVAPGTYNLTNVNSQKVLGVQNNQVQDQGLLWQYDFDSMEHSQQWILNTLGHGEYSIQNAANPELYVEADNDNILRLTANFSGAINQKFRIALGSDGQSIIYTSAGDDLWEIPNAAMENSQVKLWPHTNHPCQKWVLSEAKTIEDNPIDSNDIEDPTSINTLTASLAQINFKNNILQISFTNSAGEVNIQITDILGKPIWKKNHNTGNALIANLPLNTGVYVLKLSGAVNQSQILQIKP
ncbi:MAG: family 43 glycosylhydrolase [Fibrobacter sp.]|nr:family 43 glycosylhydrolase [Fibrobacter sp.]